VPASHSPCPEHAFKTPLMPLGQVLVAQSNPVHIAEEYRMKQNTRKVKRVGETSG
jgi:hypothetical protein